MQDCCEYVFASGNRGKLQEMAAMLKPLGIRLRSQQDWQVAAVQENAPTFVENALIKARQAVVCTGLPAIADDSGLVVPFLNGEPGIYSARYAGEDADDQANIDKLLSRLEGISGDDRQAWFYCAMVLVRTVDDPAPVVATACWYGEILHAPRGDAGFGYDPVFGVTGSIVSDRQCSAAELAPRDKNRISHRAQALTKLISLAGLDPNGRELLRCPKPD